MNRRLVQQLIIFTAPFILYLASTGSLAFYSGEFTPLNQIVTMQQGNSPVLYGRAYKDNYFSYKLLSTEARSPQILALSSSRINQFRSMFFNKDTAAFYNAAQSVQSIYQARQFLESLDPNRLP